VAPPPTTSTSQGSEVHSESSGRVIIVRENVSFLSFIFFYEFI